MSVLGLQSAKPLRSSRSDRSPWGLRGGQRIGPSGALIIRHGSLNLCGLLAMGWPPSADAVVWLPDTEAPAEDLESTKERWQPCKPGSSAVQALGRAELSGPAGCPEVLVR
ncbi:hypothetical protein NDU88_002236 [Pleurodeles waltl]|uniref:Uncharacterized protein n=1 Tax=Pleurodeles waltl TaxID=8319 RepID=A0AAV7UAN5_PLEWA|nr:hypothetical protein NDU88_002236 [Pleurodeles waltl]